jgi:rubrerythrin
MESSTIKGEGIMQCSIADLKNTIEETMIRFDNYQQIFSDINKPLLVDYFSKAYDEIEKTYFSIKNTATLNNHSRNELRMLIKYAEKRANHEIWHTCTQCGYEYDLRQDVVCPKCGLSFNCNN